MNIIVKTTGSFELLCPEGQFIPFNRPSVVRPNSFTDQRMASKQLKLVGTCSDEATDADFEKNWDACGGDEALAIESFCSQFPDGVPPAPTQEELAAAEAKRAAAEKAAEDKKALAEAAAAEAKRKLNEEAAASVAVPGDTPPVPLPVAKKK